MSAPVTYTAATAATATGLSADVIKRAIRSGALRAKSTGGIDADGRTLGKYLIRPADLEAWIDGMEDA